MVTKTYSGDLSLRHFPWRLGLDPAWTQACPRKSLSMERCSERWSCCSAAPGYPCLHGSSELVVGPPDHGLNANVAKIL